MAKLNISHVKESYLVVSSLSDETMFIFTWTVYCVLCQVIIIFGIVTNIINIICFISQGFHDSTNVSLLGLSISDLGSLITLSLTAICYTPVVSTADLDFDPAEVIFLIMMIPHLSFSRVTSWITASITLERCLCIVAPLKVKRIITPERAIVIIVSLFVVLSFSAAPEYVVNKLGMKFSPTRNKTIFGLVYTDDRENVEKVSFAINNFFLPFIAFIIIVLCTITLVIKLENTTKWRDASAATKSQSNVVSRRNHKVSKMVLMISTLFIVCFTPISITMLAVGMEPQLSFSGKYVNIGILLGGLCFVLESINSSANIFIYYNMSSKYKDTFQTIFRSAKLE